MVAGFAETWPPKLERNTPMPTNPPPYLVDRPAVIPIDVGRQLFVDDYLLDETKGLTRVYNHPVKMFDGPVLWPETPLELEEDVARPHRFAPVCAATSGGLWWDPVKKVFRLWYEAGWMKNLCYAESKDGLTWEKSLLNPIFTKGTGGSWEQDRVGGCEVHPLPDGSWVMFYIGYSDIHTAHVGAAVSKDGVTQWRRLKANPIVKPTPDTFDASACYKPSVVRDEANNRWLLWYNGRNGKKGEYIGLVVKEGLDLGALE